MNSERIEAFFRDATAADVLRVINGEEVEARFRDYDSHKWKCWRLDGWTSGGVLDRCPWAAANMVCYRFCQVYDPPQWWLNKPEPGEEYRLLKKFPDEDLQPGDAFFENNQWWPVSLESPCPQVRDVWYRRKIEQPKPEPKHYTLQVGDTCDVPSGHRIVVTELGIEVQ